MRILFILFLSIVATTNKAWTQDNIDPANLGVDIDQQDPYMDAFYQRGPYLLYDCRTKHWVCTHELEYKRCKKQRKKALLDFNKILPCAHIEMFEKRIDCRKTQQDLTNDGRYEQFCLHPKSKVNKLDF